MNHDQNDGADSPDGPPSTLKAIGILLRRCEGIIEYMLRRRETEMVLSLVRTILARIPSPPHEGARRKIATKM